MLTNPAYRETVFFTMRARIWGLRSLRSSGYTSFTEQEQRLLDWHDELLGIDNMIEKNFANWAALYGVEDGTDIRN